MWRWSLGALSRNDILRLAALVVAMLGQKSAPVFLGDVENAADRFYRWLRPDEEEEDGAS